MISNSCEPFVTTWLNPVSSSHYMIVSVLVTSTCMFFNGTACCFTPWIMLLWTWLFTPLQSCMLNRHIFMVVVWGNSCFGTWIIFTTYWWTYCVPLAVLLFNCFSKMIFLLRTINSQTVQPVCVNCWGQLLSEEKFYLLNADFTWSEVTFGVWKRRLAT